MSSKSRPTDDRTWTDCCKSRIVLHIVVLYVLIGILVLSIVIRLTDREKQAQIARELQQLQVRCNVAEVAEGSVSWHNQATALNEKLGPMVKFHQQLGDDAGFERIPSQQKQVRQRRHVTLSSQKPKTSNDTSNEHESGETSRSDESANSSYPIPAIVLKEVCLAVQKKCLAERPGTSGARGPPGPPGMPGLGIPGQKGEPGEKGHTGSTGAQGLPGALGIKGDKGDPGAVGQTGTPGLKGDQGAPGTAGLPGLPGVPGENGTKGEKGNPGRPTTMQLPDKTKIDTGCCDYILNDTLLRSLKGDKGDQGEKGQPGERGIAGSQGAIGEKGDKGDRGERGLPGVEGPAGINGTDGLRGKRGKPGEKGEVGLTGAKGSKGSKGDKGEAGRGEKGDKGAMGPPGLSLRVENSSEFGMLTGMRGLPGPPGLPGPKGISGDRGYSCGCDELTTEEMTTEMVTTPEPTVEPRLIDCQIDKMGKPVYQSSINFQFGMWLKDSARSSPFKESIWMTKNYTGNLLLRFDNIDQMGRNQPAETFELHEHYFGTGNVVYNGSFFYHRAGYNQIIKFDFLRNETTAQVTIDQAAFQNESYLYSTEYNYFDLSVEENGLWVVYRQVSEFDFLRVSKLSTEDLSVIKTWKIPTEQSRAFGNGWITCGVLYLVHDVTSGKTSINIAYDLYTQQPVNVDLQFHNPYHMNNMIAYNHNEKMLYSWDNGHLLIYPMLQK